MLLAFCTVVFGQSEAQNWTVISSPTNQDLWSVAYDGSDTFYAVGQGGTILSSFRGLSWQQVASGTTNWLVGVTYANGPRLIVAVGDQGTILASRDGIAWTRTTCGIARLDGVAASPKLILAVGEGGAIARSTDGVNWTSGNAGVPGWLRGIVYANNHFLITGQNGILLSTVDGINFTALDAGTTSDLESIAYGGGLYVVAGSGGYLADSLDGAAWTVRTPPVASHLRGVATFGTQGISVGSGGNIFATYLGRIGWQTAANPTGLDLYSVVASPTYFENPAAAGPNRVVAVGQGGVIVELSYAEYLPQPLHFTGPPPYSVPIGGTLQWTAVPGGASPQAYQWTYNGQPIPGATSPTLTLPNVQVGQSGSYELTVVNEYTTVKLGGQLTVAYAPTIPNFVDEGFNPSPTVAASLQLPTGVIAVQPDGKAIVLPAFGGMSGGPPVRLKTDGSVDSSFNAPAFGQWEFFYPTAVLVQTDGKILLSWTGVPGPSSGSTTVAGSERLNPDGTVDANYVPHTVTISNGSDSVSTQDAVPIVQLIDGRYLAWTQSGWQRLTPNGAIDTTYAPLAFPGSQTTTALLDASGRVVVGMTDGRGTNSSVRRLNADGTLDPTFNGGLSGLRLSRLHPQADGKVVFEATSSTPASFPNLPPVTYHLGRLNADGSVDASYPGLTLPGSGTSANWTIGPTVAMADGSILVDVSGNAPLPLIDGTYHQGIVRIDPNGTFDPSFRLNFEAASETYHFALQPDGNILAWGIFSVFNGEPHANLVRIHPAAGANFPSLVNLSARGAVGPGGQALIVGFVVNSSTTKTMLLRGIGPGLSALGVPGTLPDPQLALINGAGNAVLADDNWQDNGAAPALTAAADRLGAFPLADGSLDAGALATIGNGSDSLVVTETSGRSGVVLAEVYDADSSLPRYGGSRLVNFSCRSFAGSGANTLIVGFVVRGANTKQVFIRAIGPSLAGFGVTGTLPDPVLTLYSGTGVIGSGTVGENSPANIQTAQLVGAFELSRNTSDSVLAITLSLGPYTAQVSSANGQSGIALLEVYEVP